MKLNKKTLLLTLPIIISACSSEPKQLSSVDESTQKHIQSTIFSETPQETSSKTEIHTVVVREILPATKYVYLKVEEQNKQFWIATLKQEVEIGATYFYSKALHKTNFRSKEHNRVFDELYLVSKLVSASHGSHEGHNHASAGAKSNTSTQSPLSSNAKTIAVTVKELVENPSSYKDHWVQISGECTKVNPAIMDRNWIHIKDGSKDDFDLIVTSNETVQVGQQITFKARIALNKDFGAGYSYELILEEGKLLN